MRLLILLSLWVNWMHAQDNTDSSRIRTLFTYNLTESKSYENLRVLCKTVGARLSGSTGAQKAVEWARQAMWKAGADTVFLIPCKVPHWIRGSREQAKVFSKNKTEALSVCALGGSIATPLSGIKAKVIEVTSFEALQSLGEDKVKGNIVFYNVFFDEQCIYTGTAYGKAVRYRSGASMAAKYGAIASVTRSMTTAEDDAPHTGLIKYDSLIKQQIPAFALSAKGAKRLHDLLLADQQLELFLFSDCKTVASEVSYSVVGEIRGSEFPNEIIVVGGHLDSWDLGEGAHDDGAGIVQSIELLSAFKKSEIKNKRTIRCVAFMNEENGTQGGISYAHSAASETKKHIAALESDMGGFTPRAIGVVGAKDTLAFYKKWQPLLEPYGLWIKQGGGGVDISELENTGTAQFSLEPDSQRYFDLHHSSNDVFELVNKRELELGAAAIHSFIYLLDKYGTYKK